MSENVKPQTRAETARAKEWVEPNQLDVPEALKDRLRSQGLGTRWIRIFLDGKDDPVNVMTRMREGYQFVKKSQCPEWPDAPSYEDGKHGDLIIIGDLALAVLPLEISRSRTRQMQERTKQLSDAVDRQLYENAVMNKLMPVRNDSISRISRGRKPVLDTEE
jgi:hypothetical protein